MGHDQIHWYFLFWLLRNEKDSNARSSATVSIRWTKGTRRPSILYEPFKRSLPTCLIWSHESCDMIFDRWKESINTQQQFSLDTSQLQFRLISCTKSFLSMNVRPKHQISNPKFRWYCLSEPGRRIHGRGLGSDNKMGRQTTSVEQIWMGKTLEHPSQHYSSF